MSYLNITKLIIDCDMYDMKSDTTPVPVVHVHNS